MSLAAEQHRAELLSSRVHLSEDLDRVVPKSTGLTPTPNRERLHPCPTCEDGTLTISHPRRCRECEKEGL
jgi:hypothetical protein